MLFFQVIYPRSGGLYVGQTTYGDLPVHLGIITNLREEQVFPREIRSLPERGSRIIF